MARFRQVHPLVRHRRGLPVRPPQCDEPIIILAFLTTPSCVTELRRIPHVADAFEARGLWFQVVDMDGYRVDMVLVSHDRPAGVRAEEEEG